MSNFKNVMFYLVLFFYITGSVYSQAETELSPAEHRFIPEMSLTVPNEIHYKINVRLDHEQHFLDGEETVILKNNSPDILTEVYFYLYPNRLNDELSVFAREDSIYVYDEYFPRVPGRGYTRIPKLQVDGKDISCTIDDTLMRFELPEPLIPGDEIEISMAFRTRIPCNTSRFGYMGTNYYMALWYPKLAPYDKNGWAKDVMHSFGPTEFYGDFAVYDVSIDLPANFIQGATGKLESEENLDSRTVYRYHAENVHDFAWVADPKYIVAETDWNGIKIRSLVLQTAAWMKNDVRSAEFAKDIIRFYSETIGMYPYENFTLAAIKPPGWAMEYPQLIMNSELIFNVLGINMLESIIAHETGHQWFYGIIGNHETKEPWLDEGFTTFLEVEYFRNKYGDGVCFFTPPIAFLNHLNLMLPYKENSYQAYFYDAKAGRELPLSSIPYEREGLAASLPYEKGSMLLEALRSLTGEEVFCEILSTYYREFQFTNVTTRDFINVAEAVSGKDLTQFFHDWYETANTSDLEIQSIRSRKEDGQYVTRVAVRQNGEMRMPAPVEVTLKNGEVLRQVWEGNDDMGTLTFTGDSPAHFASIDPDKEIADLDRINNYSRPKLVYKPFSGIPDEDAYTISGIAYPLYDFSGEEGIDINFNFNLEKYIDWIIGLNGAYNITDEELLFSTFLRKKLWKIPGGSIYSIFGFVPGYQYTSASFNFNFWQFERPRWSNIHSVGLGGGVDWNSLLDSGLIINKRLQLDYFNSLLCNNGFENELIISYSVLPPFMNNGYLSNQITASNTSKFRLWWKTYLTLRLTAGGFWDNSHGNACFTLANNSDFIHFNEFAEYFTAASLNLTLPVPYIGRFDLFGIPLSLNCSIFINGGTTWTINELNTGFDWNSLKNKLYAMEIGMKFSFDSFPSIYPADFVFPLWVNRVPENETRQWFVVQ